ncbi:hypothetical protein M3Y99_01723400 [Aphelenchoides fujianensis]|nr:hypothetical protein M3Y99_01723400 [Aphelenchoides fujianensis]
MEVHSQRIQPHSLPSTMTLTVSNTIEHPFWTDNSPLRCASNSVGMSGSKKRDFRFQIIEVHQDARKWFVWRQEPDRPQTPVTPNNSGSSDQENQRDVNTSRRSGRYASRRKSSGEMQTPSPVAENEQPPVAAEGDLCPATATTHLPDAPMSEPTTRRITSKAIRMECRCGPSKMPASGSSSGDSVSSRQSTDSTTFQILSVASRDAEDEEEEEEVEFECTCRQQPLLFVSNAVQSTSN